MRSKKSTKGNVRPRRRQAPVHSDVPATPVKGAPPNALLDEQVYMLDALQEEFRKRGYVPYTRTRIWQLEQVGAFPARVKLGAEKYSRIGWLRREVDSWFREKLAVRPENRWRPRAERSEPELEVCHEVAQTQRL